MAHSKFSLFTLLAFMCAAVVGCGTTTTTTNSLSSDPKVVEEITRMSADKEVMITLTDGSQGLGSHVAVRTDSTEWYANSPGVMKEANRRVVPTAAIRSISSTSDKAPQGLLSGAALGFVVGGVLAYGFANSFGGNSTEIVWSGVFEVAGLFALVGGVLGLVSGALSVETTEYVRDSMVMQLQNNFLHSNDTFQTKLPH